MRTSIHIRNFRSIESTSFDIKPGLNVLVGSNGSGKTNLLTSLKFLSYVVKNGAALAMGKIGGPSRNFRRGTNSISFVVTASYGRGRYNGREVNFSVRWELAVSLLLPDQIVYVSKELVEIFAEVGEANHKAVFRVEVERSGLAPQRPRIWIDDENSLTRAFVAHAPWVSSGTSKSAAFREAKEGLAKGFADYKDSPPDASFITRVAPFGNSLHRLLRDISSLDEYNIQPDVARQASDPLPITRMGNDGSGVSEVINALETHKFKRIASRYDYFFMDGPYFYGPRDVIELRNLERGTTLAEIAENLSAGISRIDKIGTDIDPSTGRRYVVFYSGDNRFRPEEVSDGTIKWLCLLVALFVPRSRVVVLEEPENFMHPWMQQRFVSLARDLAKKSESSVILSTHSVTVLNAIELDELMIVHSGDTGTEVMRVPDRDSVQNVLKESSFGLGDIWVSGIIGGVAGG